MVNTLSLTIACLLPILALAVAPQNIFLGVYSSATEAGAMRTVTWDGKKLKQVASQPRAGNGASWITFSTGAASTLAYTVNDHATPNQHALHAYSFGGRGAEKGSVLTPINAASSGDYGTVHASLSRHPDARCLYAANYGGKSSAVLHLAKDGSIEANSRTSNYYNGSGPVTDRQDQSRPHQIIDSPDGKFVYVPDLGADKVHVLSLTHPPKCKLVEQQAISVTPGDGPRHMTFYTAADGTVYGYLVTELSGTLRVYKQDSASGTLDLLQVVSTRPPLRGQQAAVVQAVAPSEVIVTPDGRFVYVAVRDLPHPPSGNRTTSDPKTYKNDLIATYKRNDTSGELDEATVRFSSSGGHNPRHFSLDPMGKWLAVANQGDDGDETATGAGLAILSIDTPSGLPRAKMFMAAPGAAVAQWAPVSVSL